MKSVISMIPLLLAAAVAAPASNAQTLDTQAVFNAHTHSTLLQIHVRGPAFGQCWLLVADRLVQPISIPPFGQLRLNPGALSTIGPFPLNSQGQTTLQFQHSWQQPFFALAMQAVAMDRFQRLTFGEAISLTHNVLWTLAAVIPTTLEYKALGLGGVPIIKYNISVKAGDVITVVRCRAGVAPVELSSVTAPVDGDLYGAVPSPAVVPNDDIKLKVNGTTVANTQIP